MFKRLNYIYNQKCLCAKQAQLYRMFFLTNGGNKFKMWHNIHATRYNINKYFWQKKLDLIE
jgi:hypothetical protein